MGARAPKEFVQHLRNVYMEDGLRSEVRLLGMVQRIREPAARGVSAARLRLLGQRRGPRQGTGAVRVDAGHQHQNQDRPPRSGRRPRHCKDVKTLIKHTFGESFEADDYEPVPELTECFYHYYLHIEEPGAYFAAHNAAGERTALYMLEELAATARSGRMEKFCQFAERIIPEERLHVRLGEVVIEQFAKTAEDQERLERFFREGLEAHWKYTEGVFRKISSMSN